MVPDILFGGEAGSRRCRPGAGRRRPAAGCRCVTSFALRHPRYPISGPSICASQDAHVDIASFFRRRTVASGLLSQGVTPMSYPFTGDSMLQTATLRHFPEQTAVLLNANAKQVSPRVRETLSGLVPADNLFFSRDRDDAHRIADAVMSRGFDTVFTGGGDGTFVSWVNHILDRAETRDAPAPRFGILALGTGNAVAEMVGAGRPVDDLRRHVSGEVMPGRRLDLVTCDGRRTPFAGVGIDAAVLNDYNWLRTRLGAKAGRLAAGMRGYSLAIALRSAPRQVFQRKPSYCEILNTGGAAWRLDPNGERMGRPIEHGELLVRRPVHAGRRKHGPLLRLQAAGLPLRGAAARDAPGSRGDAHPGPLPHPPRAPDLQRRVLPPRPARLRGRPGRDVLRSARPVPGGRRRRGLPAEAHAGDRPAERGAARLRRRRRLAPAA